MGRFDRKKELYENLRDQHRDASITESGGFDSASGEGNGTGAIVHVDGGDMESTKAMATTDGNRNAPGGSSTKASTPDKHQRNNKHKHKNNGNGKGNGNGNGNGNGKQKQKKMKKNKKAKLAGDNDATFTDDSYNHNNPNEGLSFMGSKLAIQYLTEYKQGAEALHEGTMSLQQFCSSITPPPSFIVTSENKDATDVAAQLGNNPAPIVIGRCVFPSLTQDMLTKPYLMLPKNLTGRKRRMIHSYCVDVGLFHTSKRVMLLNDATQTNELCRVTAISIFSNGLDYLEQAQSTSTNNSNNNEQSSNATSEPPISDVIHPPFSVLTFKPWFCRRTNPDEQTVQSMTEHYKDKIQRLVDQPGDCLRPLGTHGADVLDFEALEGKDLSDVAPPGTVHGEDWLLVDTPARMDQCIQEITSSKPTELAFDLESYNRSKNAQLTCLIQLKPNNGKSYIIDPLAPSMWTYIGDKLRPLFADPTIVKIGHGIGGLDVTSLHRDFGVFVVNAFDTFEAADCLRFQGKGLAKICAKYNLRTSKAYERLKAQYQTTDWRQRPLTQPMLLYARYDVQYLVVLRQLLMRDLTRYELWDRSSAAKYEEAKQVASSLAAILRQFDDEDDAEGYATPMDFASSDEEDFFQDSRMNDDDHDDDDEVAADQPDLQKDDEPKQTKFDSRELRMQLELMQVISRTQYRCEDLWSSKPESHGRHVDYLALRKRCESGHLPTWTAAQSELYDKLGRWRNFMAAKEQCLSGFACPTELLISIAYKRPTTMLGLKRLLYKLPPLIKDTSTGYMDEIFDLVKQSLNADSDAATPNEGDKAVPFYEEKSVCEDELPIEEASRSLGRSIGDGADVDKRGSSWSVGSGILAATAVAAGAAVVLALSRGRRR